MATIEVCSLSNVESMSGWGNSLPDLNYAFGEYQSAVVCIIPKICTEAQVLLIF